MGEAAMCEEDERQTTATDVAEDAEPNLGDGLRALPLVADDLYDVRAEY